MRLLFICARNRLRSPTAERVFAGVCGVETCSAGVSPDAEQPLTADLIEWADVILVMEPRHRAKMARTFGRLLRGKRVACLGIPDDYGYMTPSWSACCGIAFPDRCLCCPPGGPPNQGTAPHRQSLTAAGDLRFAWPPSSELCRLAYKENERGTWFPHSFVFLNSRQCTSNHTGGSELPSVAHGVTV